MADASERARLRIENSYREGKKGFLNRARRAAGALRDAEDVVQDAFVSALANVSQAAEVVDVTSWIYSIVRNRVIDLWRRDRTRESAGEVDVAEETIAEIVGASGLDPQDALIRDELSDALTEAIDALPDRQRDIIIAQVFDGTTFREISEQTGTPIETLAARKKAAIRALSVALRGWFSEEEL